MTRRPLIGLSGRRKTASQLVGTPESLHHLEGDWYYADYARGVLAAGGLPVHLPLDAAPEEFADHLDGVLISGGADVNPKRYGAQPDPTTEFEDVRDDYEFALLDLATERELPVLGICRGLQLLNVHSGGTLHQDVPTHARYDIDPATLSDTITINSGSTLAELYGPSAEVNSLHHQTVDVVGADLTVTARSGDGTVEGLEHDELPMIAVQWHPEMLDTRDTEPVFAWIVEQSLTSSER